MAQNKWQRFDGEYEKQWYDVETKAEEIFEHCWPNANQFHADDGTVIGAEYVVKIRVSEKQG